MPVNISVSLELEDALEKAEALLINPTPANMQSVAAIAGDLVGRAKEAVGRDTSIAIRKSRLARLGRLLDNALRLRLGAARISVTGQAGYSAGGQLAGVNSNGTKTTVAVI
jgi:hypothetical protein